MAIKFDTLFDRRLTDSLKWNRYDADVLPLWVADMDFAAAPAVTEALRTRIDHPIYGYGANFPGLVEAIQAHLLRHFDWNVPAEAIVYLPGVIVGFNLAAQTLTSPGGSVVFQTPVYMPFFKVAGNTGLRQVEVDLVKDADSTYRVDWENFEAAIADNCSLFLLCNPHNPVGRVFTADELLRMAEICQKYSVPICSDEIHADLVYSGHRHVPLAALSPESARNTITLMAPSKTFNIPGLDFSFAIIPDPEMRKKFEAARRGLVGYPNVLGMHAARAAYEGGQEWLAELLVYLEGNRDALVDFVRTHLPAARITAPEGTYLAWLDLSEYNLEPSPCAYLVEHARVGLNDGKDFGQAGTGHVRINFACPRSTLMEALERMRIALEKVQRFNERLVE